MATNVAKQLRTLTKIDEAEITRILDQLDLEDFTTIFGDISEALTALALDSSSEALLQIGVDTVDGAAMFEFVNRRAAEWAKGRAAEMVGMKEVNGLLIENPDAKWRIDDSTREMLRSSVTDAIENGWSNQRLANEIKDDYAFSSSRAEMVARTETAFADVKGNMIAYRDSGLVAGKEWVTAHDDKVSDECQANEDAGVIGLGDSFPSGAEEPPEHPNCRCDVLPVLNEDFNQKEQSDENEDSN
jgi:SPP1 gp7 family putative phage head morphogenesis protein